MSALLPAQPTDLDKGKHYDLIKTRISDCFQTAPPHRTEVLTRLKLKFEKWHTRDAQLREANKQAWITQSIVDQFFTSVQDVYAFAAPLLQARLLEKYGVEDDVRTTFLRLYIARNSDWWVIDTSGGVTTRTVSLLDAALHNFAAGETFEDDCAFITEPDANGQFEIKSIKNKMSIQQFQDLCRELDIGSQYSKHLQDKLKSPLIIVREPLKAALIACEKAALTAAAALALIKGDINQDAHRVVTQMLAGTEKTVRNGKVIGHGALALLETTLTGIVVFGTADRLLPDLYPIIVYVPNDPDHPLKEYKSSAHFVTELSTQLRENRVSASSQMSYRQFFSQFVDHNLRGHFFAKVEEHLNTLTWHKKDPLDQRPTWRETPVKQPDLQYRRISRTGDLAEQLYLRKIDKVLRDARDIAVSTADADSEARKAWWDNFLKIVSDLFNAALMVVTPLVPVIGELMLAYTAYQVSTEVIDGVVDLAEGHWVEATEHLIGVLNEAAQMAAIGAGAFIGQVLVAKASAFVDGMLPVTSGTGTTRLWNPDLAPYERLNSDLPVAAKPDANGLYTHEGKQILQVADKQYEVGKDSVTGKQYLRHPKRGDAYQPRVDLNGAGAYVLETEQPRTWDNATLLRRIGPSVESLSDAQLETARQISATDPGELRAMYVENQHPPVLLTDTIARLDVDQDIQTFIDQMNSDDPVVYGKADSVTQMQVLTAHGMWPEKASMRIIDRESKTIWEYTGTEAGTGKRLVVQIQERQLLNGELLKTVMATLDENGTSIILDLPADSLPASLEVRTGALRKRIASVAQSDRTKLFNEDYASREHATEKMTQLVRDKYPDIPQQGIKNLLAQASQGELQIITDQGRLPLRLKRRAYELQLETRTARGSEGFYRDSLINADTERLTLGALRVHSDSLSELRIEIRDDSFDGTLRNSAGAEDAATVRILVRNKDNRYEVHDSTGTKLHEATDLFQALLQALPEDKRRALGYNTGEANLFKQWVMVKTETASERRTLLDQRQPSPLAKREDLLLLRGPSLSKKSVTLQERVRDLYPDFNDREVQTFVQSLNARGDAIESLKRLKTELNDLREQLEIWQSPHTDSPSRRQKFSREGGEHIKNQLIKCFERKSTAFGRRSLHPEGGYTLDLSTDPGFSKDLELWWKKLPNLRPYFEQITTLNLDDATFGAESSGLLKDFPNVRHLSARQCKLTQLPQGIGRMPLLETLRLTGNKIRLAAADVERLANLTRLETLRLDANPLGASVNVARMPRLKVLSLNNTGSTGWPEGLFSLRRPRSFFLDMLDNPITRIPTVQPGSEQAFIIARTRIFTENISDELRATFRDYRKSVGINPDFYTSARIEAELTKWKVPKDIDHATGHAGLGAYRVEAWHDLAGEENSSGFFSVIEGLVASADYLADGEPRQQLTDRVWRMVDAAYLDDTVRDEMFEMALFPTNCADAGAQLFNNMGIKVLVSEAYSYSTSAEELQTALVKVAKGAARLGEVSEIAREDIKSRGGDPDEVEVHLAYETGLAPRLDLPWQSYKMRYREIAGVSDEMIDQAYDKIIKDERADGLVNLMLDQPFWTDYLKETFAHQLNQNTKAFQLKVGLLEDLREAQQAWADARNLPEAEQAPLKANLIKLAGQWPVPEDTVLTGNPMTDETYATLTLEMADEEKALSRTLTRQALARVGA